MNIAALAQTAMQNLMDNQIKTFQDNVQSSFQNGLNNQSTSSNSSFQTVFNNQLSSLQNNASAQNSLSDVSGIQAAGQADGTSMFKDIAMSLTSSVTQTDSTFQADILKAAKGELDNPHQLLIDSEKANISLQMAISVRNKALEAYNDIIRMQV